MRQDLKARLGWLIGLLLPWAALWAILGAITIWVLRARPHPFLPSQKLSGILLRSVIEWSLDALAAHVVLCLVTGFILLLTVAPMKKDASPLKGLEFSSGVLAGSGTLLWFHGIAYLQIPLALDRIPLLSQLPIGLSLAGLLAAGFWLVLAAVRRHQASGAWLRSIVAVLLLTGLQFVPHDLFRRTLASQPALGPEVPRLYILSFDGMNRDAFDNGMPAWKMADGTLGVCASPASRTSWELLLGADPAMVPRASMMPYQSEILHPERLTLIRRAKELGIRTAFQIDNPATLSFGVAPSLFTTVREPAGGWKYFLTLVGSTTWPVHSFAQNFYSPVETSNPWSSLDAFWRDADRLLKGHHLVATHHCGLHWPVVLSFGELRDSQGWRWLAHRPKSYRPMQGSRDLEAANGETSPLADPLAHYFIRSRRLLRSVEPWVAQWEREYPALSGVMTADHGEYHPPIEGAGGKVVNHFAGMHGFGLQPAAISIPIHAFGTTKIDWAPRGPLSWYEVRDGIQQWLKAPELGLQVSSRPEGLLVVIPAIRGVHVLGNSADGALPQAGETPTDLRDKVMLTPDGMWFTRDPETDPLNKTVLAYAFLERERITTFNPLDKETYLPKLYTETGVRSFQPLKKSDLLEQIGPLERLIAKPLNWEQPPVPAIGAKPGDSGR